MDERVLRSLEPKSHKNHAQSLQACPRLGHQVVQSEAGRRMVRKELELYAEREEGVKGHHVWRPLLAVVLKSGLAGPRE